MALRERVNNCEHALGNTIAETAKIGPETCTNAATATETAKVCGKQAS